MSIAELMNRDPLQLTDQNLDQIIEYMRGQRHLFVNNPGAPAKPKAAKKPLTERQEALKNIDFGDLKL